MGKLALCAALLCGCLLSLPLQAAWPTIDLATLESNEDMVAHMAVRDDNANRQVAEVKEAQAAQQVLEAPGWLAGDAARALLPAPKQFSTIWLGATLQNTGAKPLQRWINFSPWRLTRVDAWGVAPDTGQVMFHAQTGMSLTQKERTLPDSRALIPITLLPGERQHLLVRIHSASRPFLSAYSQDPVAYTAREAAEFHRYSLAMACILTLLAVLLLQRDRRYALIGLWMLVAFILESEKEGYISHVLLPALSDYANHIRFTSWILTSALFLAASVVLLGQQHHKRWRLATYAALGASGVFAALTLVLDAEQLRRLGSVLDLSIAAGWLGLVPGAWRTRRPWQRTVLCLLGAWWLAYTFILLGYVSNLYYTSQFATFKVSVEVAATLGLLMVYAQQKRAREQQLEKDLRHREHEHRTMLEATVAERTRELRQAVDEAHEANAAKSDFLARISHDLRSPLTSIMGYAQLLGAEHGRVGTMSRTIHSSATHMLNLVERLIGYAQGATRSTVCKSDFYFLTFLEDIEREADTAARVNGNTFTMTTADNLPLVLHEDATSLRQILLNLLDNAAKHTHRGHIQLSVSRRDADDGMTLYYRLEDTGCGMPEHVQQRLWEPFYQARSDKSGMGLGLAIVHQLTQQLGGHIQIESDPGHGTRITLALPAEPGQESRSEQAISALPLHTLPHLDARGLSAWIVEDAAAIREMLQAELEEQGFDVQAFASAEAFARALEDAPVSPDVVLTDYLLPGQSGDHVVYLIQQRYPNAPVVLLSATRQEENHSDSYAARLPKPVDLATLRRTLARVCRRPLQAPECDRSVLTGQAQHSGQHNLKLAPEEQHHLATLVELGAVTDLMEWSQALAERDAERQPAALALHELAAAGRLEDIRQWLSNSSNSSSVPHF